MYITHESNMSSFHFPSERSSSYNPKYYIDNGASEVTQAELDAKLNRVGDTLVNASFSGGMIADRLNAQDDIIANLETAAPRPWSYFDSSGGATMAHYNDSSILGAMTGGLDPGESDVSFVQTGKNPSASGTAFAFYKAESDHAYTNLVKITNLGDIYTNGTVHASNLNVPIIGTLTTANTTNAANITSLTTTKANTVSPRFSGWPGFADVFGPATYPWFQSTAVPGSISANMSGTHSELNFVNSGGSAGSPSTTSAFDWRTMTSTTASTVLARLFQNGDFSTAGNVSAANITAMATDIASKADQAATTTALAGKADIANQSLFVRNNAGANFSGQYNHANIYGCWTANLAGLREVDFLNCGYAAQPATASVFDWYVQTSVSTRSLLMRLLAGGDLSVTGAISSPTISAITAANTANATAISTLDATVALKANRTSPTLLGWVGMSNVGAATYPWYQNSSIFGGISSNMSGGHAELDFVNSGSSAGTPAITSAFDWRLMTSSTTSTVLARLFLNGNFSTVGTISSPTITALTAADTANSNAIAALQSAQTRTRISVTANKNMTVADITNTSVYCTVTTNDVVITLPALPGSDVGQFLFVFDNFSTGTVTLHTAASTLRCPAWPGGIADVLFETRDNVVISWFDSQYWLSKAPTVSSTYKDLTVGANTSLVANDLRETMVVVLSATGLTLTLPKPSTLPTGFRFNIKFMENTNTTPSYTVTLAIDQTATNAYWRLNNTQAASFKTTLVVSSGSYLEIVKWSDTVFVVLSSS